MEARGCPPHEAVAVVGPGGIAGFHGARLAAAGRRVVFCARRPFDRIVVDSPTAPVSLPARVATTVAELDSAGPRPWVLVGVKAHQTAGAGPWLDALCDERTVVVALQNGIESIERLAPWVRGATIVSTVVYCGAELVEPGRIRHHGTARLVVEAKDAGRMVHDLFAGSGVEVELVANFPTAAWRKLGTNVVASGICALTRRPLDVLVRPEITRLAAELLHECWAVGRAEGAELDGSDADQLLRELGVPTAGDVRPSMLQDRLAGRPTEHDAIYGAVRRAGARHGIDTPVVRAVHELVAAGDPVT